MKKAIDVAKYLIFQLNEKYNCKVTQLKLQKLVYYVQASSLAFRDKPLFEDTLEAWKHGSVAFAVREEYKQQGSSFLPIPDATEVRQDWSLEEEKVINIALETYNPLSATKLVDLNHSEQPWLNAREGVGSGESSNNPISIEDIRFYQSQFVENKGEYRYMNNVASKTKKAVIEFTFKDGTTKEVNSSEVEDFIFDNMDDLQEFSHKRMGKQRACATRK